MVVNKCGMKIVKVFVRILNIQSSSSNILREKRQLRGCLHTNEQ